jgi:hypothetical protein
MPVLLAALSCGGGSGRTVDVSDPDAPPPVSDRQPPVASQNPVSGARPPDNSQPPGGSTSTPTTPPSGGGSCVSLCMSLPEHGCQTPEPGCAEGCAELMAERCGPQIFALSACALGVACPEQLEDPTPAVQQQLITMCPNQYQALLTCYALDE